MNALPVRKFQTLCALARALAVQALLAAMVGLTSAAATAQVASCPPVAQAPTPAQMQAAQAAARDRGFLWRISKGGHSSYLFGTIHLGKLDWAFPGPTVRRALFETDTLALELDVTDPAVLQELGQAIAGSGQVPDLPAPLQERLARQTATACLPAGALDAQHPVMRAISLMMLDARWEGLDAGYGQELMLAGAARARGVPIVSLETAALQMKALIPDTPDAVVETVRQSLDQLESGSSRRVSARMAGSWAEGRLDELERYETWCECVLNEESRSAMRKLNDDRNPGLADRIASLHESGRKVFAAVGALHMTGVQALPRLLAERGFAVEHLNRSP